MGGCDTTGNSISLIFSNLRCMNPVTIWFLIFVFGIISASLTGVLTLNINNNDKKHRPLEVLFWYFIALLGFSIVMMFSTQKWDSPYLTGIGFGVALIILLFIGQYVAQKKGVCEPTKKEEKP